MVTFITIILINLYFIYGVSELYILFYDKIVFTQFAYRFYVLLCINMAYRYTYFRLGEWSWSLFFDAYGVSCGIAIAVLLWYKFHRYVCIITSYLASCLIKLLTNRYSIAILVLFTLSTTAVYAKPTQKIFRNELSFIDSSCCSKLPDEFAFINLRKNDYNLLDLEQQPIKLKDTYEKYECTCDKQLTKGKRMYKLLQVQNMSLPKIYHACWKNNMSAMLRMLVQCPKPEEKITTLFAAWFERIFDVEIKPLLKNFTYCQLAWFNHLPKKKQQEVYPYFKELIPHDYVPITMEEIREYNTYTNFVKSEKQFGATAKTRCICSPCAAYKFIMGPVTYALEQIFKNNFVGYKVPKTWSGMEEKLDEFEAEGLTATVQLDGKSFDMTQNIYLKEIVDHKIYDYISEYVHHVPIDVFRAVSTVRTRKVIPTCVTGDTVTQFGYVKLEGQVFSGSMDTTLMNTIRMSCFVRFCQYLAKNATMVNGEVRLVSDFDISFDSEFKTWVKGDDTTVFTTPENAILLEQAISWVFATEAQWLEKQDIVHGLGLISKFVKIGTIIDFDFCSTMAIRTQHGYKILRKLENIVNKEHLSVKVGQMDMDSYNNDLITSAKCWLGKEQNILSQYFELVHPFTIGAKPINKYGAAKDYIPTEFKYEDAYIDWDYKIQEERYSERSFTTDELEASILEQVDCDTLIPYIEEIKMRLLENNINYH